MRTLAAIGTMLLILSLTQVPRSTAEEHPVTLLPRPAVPAPAQAGEMMAVPGAEVPLGPVVPVAPLVPVARRGADPASPTVLPRPVATVTITDEPGLRASAGRDYLQVIQGSNPAGKELQVRPEPENGAAAKVKPAFGLHEGMTGPVLLDAPKLGSGTRESMPVTGPDGKAILPRAQTAPAAGQLPIAIPDVFTTPEGEPLVVAAPGVLANDYDPDGGPVTFALVQSPAHGIISGAATDGQFTYTPDSGFSGVDSFTYRILDEDGNLSIASLIAVLVVPSANRVPVAVPDAYTTPAGQALVVAAPGVLANDFDLDGDAVSFALVQSPAHGAISGAATNGQFTYTPDAGFSGVDAFTYQILDSEGNLSIQSLIAVLVVPSANRAPVAVPDVYTTPEGQALVVAAPGVLANDYDPDGGPVTFAIVQSPAHGTLTGAATDGQFTYSPDAGFSGTDSFIYRIIDADGALSDSSLINVTVLPAGGSAPVAVTDAYTTPQDTPLVVAPPGVLANDFDPDGDAISFALVQSPAHGTLTGAATDGQFTYTPDTGFTGFEKLTYRIIDSNGVLSTESVIAILVVPDQNRPPVAVPDVFTTPEGQALVVAPPGVLANDLDPDGDAISFALVQSPAHGTLTGAATDGGFTYTPDAGFSGVESFTYRIIDAGGNLSAQSLIAILVIPDQNRPPVAVPDVYTTPEGQALVVPPPGVLANDFDPDGDAVSFAIVQTPAHGTLTGASTAGDFTYTPDAGFSGVEPFTYRIIDTKGALSLQSLIVAFVLPANQAPVADAGPDQTVDATGPGGAVVQLDGSGSSDPDGDTLAFSWSLSDSEIATGATPTVNLPLGIHTVTLTVTDPSSASDSDQVVIAVQDTTAPVITVVTPTLKLWPPDHAYHTLDLGMIGLTVSDQVDVDLAAGDVVISRVWSDEPEDGAADGHTFHDILFPGGCRSVDLRAERDATGNGRVYTVELAVTDAQGNTGTATYAVEVPVRPQDSAQDDGAGAGYAVTGKCGGPPAQPAGNGLASLGDTSAEVAAAPAHWALEANHPNPFNPETQIAFSLPHASPVRLTVYDVQGREVARLVDGPMSAGRHLVRFSAGRLPAGMYLYRIQGDGFTQTRRMLLLK